MQTFLAILTAAGFIMMLIIIFLGAIEGLMHLFGVGKDDE